MGVLISHMVGFVHHLDLVIYCDHENNADTIESCLVMYSYGKNNAALIVICFIFLWCCIGYLSYITAAVATTITATAVAMIIIVIAMAITKAIKSPFS